MKIPSRQKIQQIHINHSSDIKFTEFKKLYKKSNVKPYCFVVTDKTLASDNPFTLIKEV